MESQALCVTLPGNLMMTMAVRVGPNAFEFVCYASKLVTSASGKEEYKHLGYLDTFNYFGMFCDEERIKQTDRIDVYTVEAAFAKLSPIFMRMNNLEFRMRQGVVSK